MGIIVQKRRFGEDYNRAEPGFRTILTKYPLSATQFRSTAVRPASYADCAADRRPNRSSLERAPSPPRTRFWRYTSEAPAANSRPGQHFRRPPGLVKRTSNDVKRRKRTFIRRVSIAKRRQTTCEGFVHRPNQIVKEPIAGSRHHSTSSLLLAVLRLRVAGNEAVGQKT